MQLRAISGVKKANPLLNAMRSSQTKIESILWKFSGKHRQALGRRRNTGRDLLLRAELSCLFVQGDLFEREWRTYPTLSYRSNGRNQILRVRAGRRFDSETLKEGLFAEIAFKHRRVEYHLR